MQLSTKVTAGKMTIYIQNKVVSATKLILPAGSVRYAAQSGLAYPILCKVVLTFESVDEIQSVTIQMKATE